MKTITPAQLHARLLEVQRSDSEEFALLDTREELDFGEGHLLYASCAALSRLERLGPQLVPRRSAPVVVIDGGRPGELLAKLGAERLTRWGYSDVSVLEGGMAGWVAAGRKSFSGINVPSKAFGEVVEHTCETPALDATEIAARQSSGEPMVILDSRPYDEYQARNIPGGVCVPGAELAYRVRDLAPDPQTTVIVNCAGRTRSIIGAQSLINAGVPNKVYALRNGTMGWHLAGLKLERGQTRTYDAPSARGLSAAQASAAAVATRYGVERIDHGTLDAWQGEREERSLFVLDVRSPAEYEAGHLPGSRSAPGGQLVQETDKFIGTLGARVVLVDDTGVRATMTASWLRQMGWRNVVVFDGELDASHQKGPAPALWAASLPDVERVQPRALAADLAAALDTKSATLIDVSYSKAHRAAHPAGARYAIRARLAERLREGGELPGQGMVVFTSEDGGLAAYAAEEIAALVSHQGRPICALDGGTAGWEAAGLPLETGIDESRALDESDDVWKRPYERNSGIEDAMRDYLTWEVGLVEQVEADGVARFSV